jgi:hypothetical protein
MIFRFRFANFCTFLFFVLLLAFPSQAQVRQGSLVVLIVSRQSDYVVIGAESRASDLANHSKDDQYCKIISLGGDTLFYMTGNAEISVLNINWNGRNAARSVYAKGQRRDAQSLAGAWRNRAIEQLSLVPEQFLRDMRYGPEKNLVTGGFINFDKKGSLFAQSVDIDYDATNHRVYYKALNPASGQVGFTGVAQELVSEFFAGKTLRAVNAFGPIGSMRLIAVDPEHDVRIIQKAIKFAMDNAVGKEKALLGGDCRAPH